MKGLFTLLCFLVGLSTLAQRNVRDSLVASPHLALTYAVQLPVADMAERFGANSNLGAAFQYKSKKNWFYTAEGGFLFGKNVEEPGFLQNLLTSNGEVIDNQGRIAELLVQQRGYTITLGAGKLFDVIGPNPNSGILVKGGVGYFQHKIRIEHQIHDVTQLEDEYLKGYDRLTSGVVFNQFVGYFHMSNSRLINFMAGLEFNEGFTKGRRPLNFDTLTTDDQPRFDGLVGIRVGWIIHFYSRPPKEFYFD